MSENPTLEEAREQLRTWINEFRDAMIQDHFPFQGKRWDCDEKSRANIIGVCTLINTLALTGQPFPDDFVWRTSDNENVPMTQSDMVNLGLAMFAYTTACYKASWYHKAVLETLATPEEVLAYPYTQSQWPTQEP